MKTVVITGSGGLIGSAAARRFHGEGWRVVGIDNNLRAYFFGEQASTVWMQEALRRDLPQYRLHIVDIRNPDALDLVVRLAKPQAIIHCASQPSHDWAAKEPQTDFGVNAVGTSNMLEAARKHCPHAPFIFTSTSKVYGDNPNRLPLEEKPTRYELERGEHAGGITENLSVDQCLHSLFGASKLAADVLVQEYGRYFGMPTVCFRPGCLTGPGHSPAELHGFLAYLVKCCATGQPYRVYGYKMKQVRDNIHADDLVECFWRYVNAPRSGEVYNVGGGRYANCSMIEAMAMAEAATGKRLSWQYAPEARIGDHVWWIGSDAKWKAHYPGWEQRWNCGQIIEQIARRWA